MAKVSSPERVTKVDDSGFVPNPFDTRPFSEQFLDYMAMKEGCAPLVVRLVELLSRDAGARERRVDLTRRGN